MSAKKQCSECSGTFPRAFFAKAGGGNRRVSTRHRCRRCEQERRDAAKKESRFRVKARAAIRTHAQKFVKQEKISGRDELEQKHGWTVERLEQDLRDRWEHGCCPYCRHPFKDMSGGLSAMTVDIRDPRDPPYYETNVVIACATCNKEKQQTPPSEWGELLSCHRQWEEWQRTKAADHWAGTMYQGYA